MSDRKTKFCINCGAEIDARAEICPRCGVRVAPPPPPTAPSSGYSPAVLPERKSEGLAAVLSFCLLG